MYPFCYSQRRARPKYVMSGRRWTLWSRDPHCHWCARLTVYAHVLPRTQPPEDLATIDHLDSRLTRRRGQMRGERTVLACYRCNQERGALECKAYPGHAFRKMARPTSIDLDTAFSLCHDGA